MIEIFRSILSVFLPEKIAIHNDVVSVSFLGQAKWTQDLSTLRSFKYHSHNQFTGGRMLVLTTDDYVGHDYFGQQIGFKILLDNVLERADLTDEILQAFSKSGYPPDGFIWENVSQQR